MSPRAFDAIVIGAGPAGEVAAGRLAEHGLEVAIAEDRLVGGECSYWACMPSKALLRPGQALAETRRVDGAAQAIGDTLDVRAALRRRDEVIHGLDDAGQLGWLEQRGITLVRGRARLDGKLRVVVGEEMLEASRAVVLAVGSEPQLPPIPGLAESNPWTNREATTTAEPPDRLAVLGGGPVGCELAQAYRSLGSEVTLLESQARLLGREEQFAARLVQSALEDSGVTVRAGAKVSRVARGDGATREVLITTSTGETVAADELLVSAGRRVPSDGLGLESVPELEFDAGHPLPVDERFAVAGSDWLFAIGDANGVSALTHEGKFQARLVADRLAGKDAGTEPTAASGSLAPRVTFTEPQIAAVGHTQASATDAGIAVRVADADLADTAGASFHGHGAPGPCRLVIDDRRDVLIGATFTGVDVAEMLHAATVAVAAELPISMLRGATPAFPTRSEIWLRLLAQAG